MMLFKTAACCDSTSPSFTRLLVDNDGWVVYRPFSEVIKLFDLRLPEPLKLLFYLSTVAGKGGTFVDFGCGIGRFLLEALERAETLKGVGITYSYDFPTPLQEMMENITRRGMDLDGRFQLVVGDVHDPATYKDKRLFGNVHCVIESYGGHCYSQKPLVAFSRSLSLLRDGGRLYYVGYNAPLFAILHTQKLVKGFQMLYPTPESLDFYDKYQVLVLERTAEELYFPPEMVDQSAVWFRSSFFEGMGRAL